MFANAVKIFSIHDFDIKVDPSWLVIAGIITWSLSQQYFPTILPNVSSQTYLAMAIVAMLLFFASLILHELSHSIVARQLGVPINSITLFIFGGVAEMQAEPKTAKSEFWIALAGPVMSLCLAFTFWVSASVLSLAGQAVLAAIASYLAVINLILAVFNLIPAFPLDGGRMLRAFLWDRSGDVLKATEIATKSGIVVGYALMSLGILALFQGAIGIGLWQILIGSFVLLAARAGYENQLARTVLDGRTVADLMYRDPITVGPNLTLSDFVDQVMLHHRVSFVPVVEASVLLGHIDWAVLSGIDQEHWGSTRVGDVFVGLDPASTIPHDFPARDLLAQMSKTGVRKYLVVDDHQLQGVITLSDFTRYLHPKQV